MKHQGKLIPVLIILSLILSLAACGSKNISGNITTPSAKPNTSGTTANEPAPEDATYEMGSTNGGVYTNDFLGIGCELDENWAFYGEEQLAELNGIIADTIDDEELAEAYANSVENGKTTYDMCAVSADGLAVINIVIESLGVLYGVSLDEDRYLDLSLETLEKSLDAAGMANVTVEKASVACAGASRPSFAIYGEQSDVPVYEKGICIKKGNYMAVITVCSYYEDITNELAGLFYSL